MSGAATIQSKNVAAVAAVAAAAAVAGLASPAATHHMKKLRVLSKKTALFFSLFLFFFLSSHLFFPMSMPALNSFSSKGGSMIFFLFFCWAFFGKTMGYLLNLILHPFVHLFSSAGVQLHQEPLLLLQDL